MSTQTACEEDDLEALFDSIVEARESPGRSAPDVACAAPLTPANESVAPVEGDAVFQRIGQLTRTLHDALRELGYDRKLEQAAQALPDAHDRLKYIAKLSGDAAERVLGDVEKGQALCGAVGGEARALDARWGEVLAGRLPVGDFRALALDTHSFVGGLPGRSEALHAQFTDIMMAQDFHDLSGQVIKRVADIVQRLEKDLLALLIATCPAEARPDDGSLSGPLIPGRAGADVVANQAQVDQLLESLGF